MGSNSGSVSYAYGIFIWSSINFIHWNIPHNVVFVRIKWNENKLREDSLNDFLRYKINCFPDLTYSLIDNIVDDKKKHLKTQT